MKKRLLFIIAICISVSSFAAPWDIKIKKSIPPAWDNILHKKSTRLLPGVIYTNIHTINANGNVCPSISLDDYTDPNGPWCIATLSVYGYYRTRNLPLFPVSYSWGWGYRTWDVEVAPGDNGGVTEWSALNSGEYFNMSGHDSYQAPYGWWQSIAEGQVTLVSFVEE